MSAVGSTPSLTARRGSGRSCGARTLSLRACCSTSCSERRGGWLEQPAPIRQRRPRYGVIFAGRSQYSTTQTRHESPKISRASTSELRPAPTRDGGSSLPRCHVRSLIRSLRSPIGHCRAVLLQVYYGAPRVLASLRGDYAATSESPHEARVSGHVSDRSDERSAGRHTAKLSTVHEVDVADKDSRRLAATTLRCHSELQVLH